MSRTMLAARLHGPDDLRLETLPCPEPGPGEVVLRVERALTCGTDLKMYRRGRHPALGPLPALFGHEVAGVVAAVGPGVTGLREGEPVVVANSAPCGRCRPCQRGQLSLCRDLVFLFGAFAQYVRVPARIVATNLHRRPAGLTAAEAALVEPLACAVHGLTVAAPEPGATVLIVGGGALGLFLARLAKLRGATVLLCDRHPDRLALARRLGVDQPLAGAAGALVETVRQLTAGEGADVVIEAVGSVAAWEEAVQLVRPGGTVVFFGGPPLDSQVALPTAPVHYGELTLRGAFHHTPACVRAALGLLASGAVPGALFISGEYPLTRLPEALAAMAARQGLKYAIDPWAEGEP